MARQILQHRIEHLKSWRELPRGWSAGPRVVQLPQPAKDGRKLSLGNYLHGFDCDGEMARKMRRFGFERPVIPTTADPYALAVLLGHANQPITREMRCLGRRPRHIERIDVLVALSEPSDQDLRDFLSPLSDRGERDV